MLYYINNSKCRNFLSNMFSEHYSNEQKDGSVPFIKEIPQFAQSENELTATAYLQDLGLDWKDLAGKVVLDLGAGLARFAQAARQRGIQVTSVDMHPEWHTETGVTP